jgi:hypothetical protein
MHPFIYSFENDTCAICNEYKEKHTSEASESDLLKEYSHR